MDDGNEIAGVLTKKNTAPTRLPLQNTSASENVDFFFANVSYTVSY